MSNATKQNRQQPKPGDRVYDEDNSVNEPFRDPGTNRTATVFGIVSCIVAAVLVMTILRKCHRDDGPVPGTAAARLAGKTSPLSPGTGDGGALAATFDRQVETSHEPGALGFKALKTQFPDDYAAYLRLYAARTTARVPPARLKAESQAWLANFISTHRSDLVRAPAPMLIALVHAQIAAHQVLLGASPELCQHYATTGLRPGDVPPPDAELPLAVVNAAKINAMGAGRHSPARAEPTEMAQADADALSAGMIRLGASADDIDHLKTSVLSLPADRQCAITIKMLQAIAALPQDQAGRVAAVIYQDPAKVR